MTTFVILAAGRGTRIGRAGEHLHKALVPLAGRAVISHLIGLAPKDANIVVCTGYRDDQVTTYLKMAHPSHDITIQHVAGWDGPDGGPGWSLLAAEPHVEGDLIFTSCDTLWSPLDWNRLPGSWLGVADLPVGTAPERWCRVGSSGGRQWVADKCSEPEGGFVHTGMGQVAEDDLHVFWYGLRIAGLVQGERQMSAGIRCVDFDLHKIDWTDVGDADSFATAVSRFEGYDWSKTSEATYVLPEEGRVVKFWGSEATSISQLQRAKILEDVGPMVLDAAPNWLAVEFLPGRPPTHHEMVAVLRHCEDIWVPFPGGVLFLENFYRDKSYDRAAMLEDPLSRAQVLQALSKIDWAVLAAGARPTRIHGDLTFGNMLLDHETLRVFDPRSDFADLWHVGDQRYDLAKLLSGCYVDWDAARHGDFRPPECGDAAAQIIRLYCEHQHLENVEMLAALCLLSSAPLHPAPFDKILVDRGLRLLARVGGR